MNSTTTLNHPAPTIWSGSHHRCQEFYHRFLGSPIPPSFRNPRRNANRMLSFSLETSQSTWFPKPQPPKQQGKTYQQTNLCSAMRGQLEIIWPSKLQRAAQKDTRKPRLFGTVYFQQAQHKSSCSQTLPWNRNAASCEWTKTGCLACEVGLLAGKHTHVQHWRQKEKETGAFQRVRQHHAISICCQLLGK